MDDILHNPLRLPEDVDLIRHPNPIMPRLWRAMRLGAANRCPVCGTPPLFAGYLRVRATCTQCHTQLNAVHADDIPPYFTILLVGHIIVPLLLLVEVNFAPPIWLEAAIFLPLTTLLTLLLLRPIKGATVAWLLHNESKADARDAFHD